ncbi:MAG: ABC transporter permease [Lachnospiraceae bacterium]
MNKKANIVEKMVLATIGHEKRQKIAIPVFSILVALIAGGIVIALLGHNPFYAFYNLLQGCGIAPKASYAGKKGMITDFMDFMDNLTPMIFAALAVAVALRSGLFNIGVSGQMLAAGFLATVTVGYTSLAAPIAKPLVVIIGILAGACVGGLIGFLKYRFNINEVVSSIMINYILEYVISFFINMYFVDPVSRQSKNVSTAARLTLTDVEVGGYKMDIPLGIILAILTVFLVRFIMNRTVFGFEMKAVGCSRTAAKYAGIKVGKNIVITMVISGALSGLAGVTYYLGYFASIQPKVLTSTGFDAIAVSLLGNNNPVGIIFSSFLITVISKGSTYMSSASGVQQEIASVITGIILLFSACGAFVRYKTGRLRDTVKERKGEK